MQQLKVFFAVCAAAALTSFALVSLRAQTQKGIPSDGRDFYIAELLPSINCPNMIAYQGYYALISSYYNCTVTVNYFDASGKEINGGTYQLQKRGGVQVPLDQSFMNPRDANGNPINSSGQQPEYTSCHIHATRPVSVSYYSTGPNSGSLYMALQTGALGKTYVVAAMPANPGLGHSNGHHASNSNCMVDSGSSEFAVIAIEDGTNVTITPSGLTMRNNVGVNCGAGASGIPVPIAVRLNRGQVYWVKSTKDDPSNDMSGSVVQSDKPVAVISGCESAFNGETVVSNLGGDQRNMSVEQMIPVEYWTTKDYVSMPTAQDPSVILTDASSGNQYKIYAIDTGTKVTVSIDNISPYIHVPAGPYSCPPLTYDNVEDGINISSDLVPGTDTGKKIMVEEYQYRQMYGSSDPRPAPEQMNIIPLARCRTSYMWQVPDDKAQVHKRRFINVIAQKSQFTHIYIIHNNGAPASLYALPSYGSTATIPGHPELQGRRFEIYPGSYYAYGDSAFALYQYGDLGLDPDNDLGDNDDDDYYFSYMSTCGISMGIDGAYSPTMWADDTCGGWLLHVVDDNPLDRGISTIDLLKDPNGVLKRRPGSDSGYMSQNVDFDPVDFTVVPGDTSVTVRIVVDNPLQDAWAYVWAVNGAGNDTLIYLHYTAPKLSFLSVQAPNDDSINFLNARLGVDTCTEMVFKNLAGSTGQTFDVNGYSFKNGSQGFRVTGTTPPLPATLAPGDSIIFNVCFNASQAAHVYIDTLQVQTNCPTPIAQCLGSTQVGQINASDYNYGLVLVGHRKCATVRVWNTGAAPFTLTKQWILDNFTDFTFADSLMLPITIQPGINNGVNLTFCFTPTVVGFDSTTQHWGSDLPEPFTQINKNFSALKGIGVQPALSWNVPGVLINTQCDTSKTVRCILSDSGTYPINVDSVGIIGADADEFSVIATQSGTSHTPFTLQPVTSSSGLTSEWADVNFTPNLAKPLPGRWLERKDTLVAYDQDTIYPLVFLNANVHHAEVDLSTNSVDLGITKPGTPTGLDTVIVTNGGDAPLIIENLTIDPPFTIVQPGSLAIGDTVPSDSSAIVIVQGLAQQNGTYSGNLNIKGVTDCPQGAVALTMSTSSIAAIAQGANITPTYICTNNVDSVSASAGSKSLPVKLISAQIIDDPSDPGGSADFVFSENNTRSIPNAGVTLNKGETQKYGVLFAPTLKKSEVADVIFTFDTASNPGIAPWNDTVKITGTGIQEHTTISLQNPQTGAYVVPTASNFQVPIQMTQPIADGADVKTITMDIAFKRDIFQALPTAVVGANGYTANWTLNQSSDPAIMHVVLTRNGNTPFDSTGTLAYLQFQVMVAKDTLTNFVVSNVSFQNTAGTDLCYVLHDTIPGAFVPAEYCQNGLLRRYMVAGYISFGIENVHPNPAANTVHLGLDVHEDGVPVTIELYNSLGQLVRSYANAVPMPAGVQTMDLDVSDVPSGAYSLRVMSPDHSTARTIVVQK